MALRHSIVRFLARRGILVITKNDPRFHSVPKNLDPEFGPVQEACGPFTMTPIPSQYGLWKAVEYVVKSDIPGDIVECGVWKGGSVMIVANALKQFGDQARKIYLYDTFEGMTAPGPRDVDFAGRTPEDHLRTWNASTMSDLARGPIDEVRRNVLSTGLPADRFVFVKGKVEETIPGTMPPGPISLLRLDTDWFDSTWHELVHLYPRLCPGGVLIIDDYAMWQGSREATDKYFAQERVKMLLNRLDHLGGVIGVKPSA
jgi:O-methyltransferase